MFSLTTPLSYPMSSSLGHFSPTLLHLPPGGKTMLWRLRFRPGPDIVKGMPCMLYSLLTGCRRDPRDTRGDPITWRTVPIFTLASVWGLWLVLSQWSQSTLETSVRSPLKIYTAFSPLYFSDYLCHSHFGCSSLHISFWLLHCFLIYFCQLSRLFFLSFYSNSSFPPSSSETVPF